jgi:uncharacterized membrane protein YfcA
MVGYRGELAGARQWAARWAIPSASGGLVGALLLLMTPPSRFDAVVPWLVLGATVLFVIQRPLMRLLKSRVEHHPEILADDRALTDTPLSVLAYQFLVGIYGGYFGAGIGILMLAALGFLGFTNIHRMNGLKNFGGVCINVVAAVTFAMSNLVDWPVAAAMAVGAMLGGYGGSRLAQRVPQNRVRQAIIVIGFVSGFWLLFSR